MKSTGIVRKIDELGRIVLPIEMRRTLGIQEKDPLEIYVDGAMIILKKYIPERVSAKNKNITYICSECKKKLTLEEIGLTDEEGNPIHNIQAIEKA
jgi:transcriptional pleiotropic regulator of transition state genes